MSESTNVLAPSLIEQVLARLGFSAPVPATLAGLRDLYARWCGQVPFDNVQKLIHVRSGDERPLPGSDASTFFQSWLSHGTGGTCWSGSTALFALLRALGFSAERGLATMLVAPHLPPNHATIRVAFGDEWYLTDSSILHHEPLRILSDGETTVAHPVWGIRLRPLEGKLHIHWRPLHKLDGFECRIEGFGLSGQDYVQRYAETREWSPFNYELYARRVCGDKVIGLAFGQAVTIHPDGSTTSRPVDDAERRRILVEDLGMSEAIASRVPADIKTPPPPGSETARAQS